MEMRLYHESNTVMPVMLALILAIVFIGLTIFLFYELAIEDVSLTSTEGIAVMASMALTLGITAIVSVIRIRVTVTYKDLRVGVFKGRQILMTDIASVEVEDFKALKDYFGWGIRLGRKGWGYIAAGTSKGLRVNSKDGKSLLISTKRPFEFENAVKMALRSLEQ